MAGAQSEWEDPANWRMGYFYIAKRDPRRVGTAAKFRLWMDVPPCASLSWWWIANAVVLLVTLIVVAAISRG